jgi:hypothetical protein
MHCSVMVLCRLRDCQKSRLYRTAVRPKTLELVDLNLNFHVRYNIATDINLNAKIFSNVATVVRWLWLA